MTINGVYLDHGHDHNIGPTCAKGLEQMNEVIAVQGEILRNSGL